MIYQWDGSVNTIDTPLVLTKVTGTMFTIEGLINGVTYSHGVTSKNSAGESVRADGLGHLCIRMAIN